MKLEYRSVPVAADDAETSRTIGGRAVPYGEEIELGGPGSGLWERFERGDHVVESNATLYYHHDHRSGGLPIGRVIEVRDAEDGLYFRAQISQTPKGDEVLALIRDGVLTHLSAGFIPQANRTETVADRSVIVHTSTRTREISVTPFPAYKTAAVTETRSQQEGHPMGKIPTDQQPTHPTQSTDQQPTPTTAPAAGDQTTTEEVEDLRSLVTGLGRRVDILSTGAGAEQPDYLQYRSAGEFLKGLARGEDAARMLCRDFGATAEANVTRPGWVNRVLKLRDEQRRIINLFATGTLPATGNSIEFPRVKSTKGTVAEQATEGAALSYMEVALDTATAPVRTYGGYSSLSRQAIERSDLAYLETVIRYQGLQWAKATEAAVRTALVNATGTNTATLASGETEAWIDLVIDAAAAVEDNSLGLVADFMVVSRDVFKTIAHKTDTANRPVFDIKGDGTNTVGSANLIRASANIGGLPVVVDPLLTAKTAVVASKDAMTTYENPGAPMALQDESIINLTKDYALYGYLAHAVHDPKGIVKCDVSAALGS